MKRRVYCILLLSVLAFSVHAQQKTNPIGDSVITPTIARPLQQMPYFIGGGTALQAFLKSNMQYPKQAIQNKTQGIAFVSFVIEKDGSLSGFKVMRAPGDGLGEEAVRILKLSPKWSPGKLEDQLIRVQFAIPVTFTLP